jgi:hypothetical protein
MLGCIGYMALNAEMIPDVAYLQGFAVALPCIVLGMVIRLHWEGWAPEPGARTHCSDGIHVRRGVSSGIETQ